MPNNPILTASLAGVPGSGHCGELELGTASRLLVEETSRCRLALGSAHAERGLSPAGAGGSVTTSWSARP
jgi:hypothetical protein